MGHCLHMTLLLWGISVLSVSLSSQAGLTVEAEPGLYYCSSLKGKQMIFRTTTYLQLKERSQISSRHRYNSEARSTDVFSILTLVFGAVIAVLLGALLILIFTRQSERKDLREQQRDASHSLRYISTAITPGTHFPQYTVVGLVDGEPLMYYDGNIRKMTPKTERIEKNEGEDFWNSESEIFKDEQSLSLLVISPAAYLRPGFLNLWAVDHQRSVGLNSKSDSNSGP
ncbi:hypothetical protein MHYP_G00262000 [Metynnis hypsauchen]